MRSEPKFAFDQVYYAYPSKSRPLNPVAIRPKIFESRVLWEDTARGVAITLGHVANMDSMMDSSPEELHIVDDNGHEVHLIKLTKEIFNEKVRSRVMAPPDFDSDQDVQDYYLNTSF